MIPLACLNPDLARRDLARAEAQMRINIGLPLLRSVYPLTFRLVKVCGRSRRNVDSRSGMFLDPK